MATLLLDRAGLEVRTDGAALALYEQGERRGSIPIALLERCVIQGQGTRLDSGVLLKLAEAGVATILLSPRVSRRVALVLGPRHNDAGVRLAQARRALDPEHAAEWSRRLVLAKLRRQLALLERALPARPDRRKPLVDATRGLDGVIETLRDALKPSVDSIRGFEGTGARIYFAGFTSLFPDSLQFTGRNRRPPRDPVNAALSLGYTMLHFEAVRALHVAGLDPLLGFYHRPAFGRESLACDLVEPLRPVVDEWVWSMFRTRALRAESFSNDKGACLLGKAARAVFHASWEQSARVGRRWLRSQARGLARALREEGAHFLCDGEESVE